MKEISQETFDVLYGRRSARNFEKGKIIPKDVLYQILDSARYTLPSPTGDYVWRMIIATDESTKKLVAECAQETSRTIFGASYETFAEHLWYMPKDSRLRVAEYTTSGELWRYPEDCSHLFLPLICRTDWGTGLGGVLRNTELTGLYQGFAAQNMWLVGHALGVGAGYNAMPLNDVRRRELATVQLGVPPSWDITGGYAFGYTPRSRPSGPSRAPLDDIVFSEYWGNRYERAAFRGKHEKMKVPQTNIFDVIKNLNLVKTFKKGEVADWQLERAIDVALWGPNPENFKMWRYIVIRDAKAKEYLYKLMAERKGMPFYFNDMEWQYARQWYVPEDKRMAKVEEILATGLASWYQQADTLIIPLCPQPLGTGWADSAHMAVVLGGRNPVSSITLGCCIQNMIVATSALGLGINFDPLIALDPRAEEPFRELFGIPPSWKPMGVIGIGQPGEKIDRSPMPPVGFFFHDEYWGNEYK